MICPNCGGRLTKVGNSYGHNTWECKDCLYAEETIDRTRPKKQKVWKLRTITNER